LIASIAELVAVAAADERVIGDHTFNHHRYAP